LGRQIACELAARGYSPIGIAFRGGRREALGTQAEVASRGGSGVLLQGDLEDSAVPGALTEDFLRASGGRLDLLVNNAGTFNARLVPRLSETEFDRQLAVNLSAPFRFMRAAQCALKNACGAVINVGSLVGMHGAIGLAAYSAAKAGLEALTRAAAAEWGADGIRVNAVIPGFMPDSAMGRTSSSTYAARALSVSPLGVPSDPATVARMLVSLAEAPCITGQIVLLDGRVMSSPALP
jgi:meso-butanediol dehydrogenase/(S,S)-butanediol dehydrogenase/diacetyl reductase